MSRVVVNMSMAEWASYMAKLGPRFIPAMLTGVRSGAAGCIPIMQNRAMYAIPASDKGAIGAVDTGLYKAAWKSTPTSTGALVYNDRPYAGVIEGGRRARHVNRQGITNLTAWAHRKLGLSGAAAQSAAFAIARSLSPTPYGKGRILRPRNVMTGGLQEMVERVKQDILDALTRLFGSK